MKLSQQIPCGRALGQPMENVWTRSVKVRYNSFSFSKSFIYIYITRYKIIYYISNTIFLLFICMYIRLQGRKRPMINKLTTEI